MIREISDSFIEKTNTPYAGIVEVKAVAVAIISRRQLIFYSSHRAYDATMTLLYNIINAGNRKRLRKRDDGECTKMIKKKLRIILVVCLMSGMILGCGAEVSDTAVTGAAVESSETEESLTESTDPADLEDDDDEEIEEPVNALGLPMREGTALVVTVTEYHYWSDKLQHEIAQEYEFDSAGHRLRYINYSFVFGKRIEYEYDDGGNLIKEIQYGLEKEGGELRQWIDYQYLKDDSENQTGWIECKYNAEGLMLSETEYDSDERLIKETVYTEGGRRFDEDGNVQEFRYGIFSKYEYDIMSNRSRRTYYDPDGSVSGWREEEYDDFGNLILSAEYDAEGNIDIFEGYECDTYMVIYPYYIYKNEYDDSGNLVRQVQYDHEGNEMEVTEKTYDSADHLIRAYYTSEAYIPGLYEYEYDNAGNLIKEIDEYIKVEREYDEKNRPIKYTKYSFGELDRWYEYEYKLIDIAEEDYPFDQINIAKYI